MSADLLGRLAAASAFRARAQFADLATFHVPFDELTGTEDYEERALRHLAAPDAGRCVTVVGAAGAGKSSLIAAVADRLPKSHAAVRIRVASLREPDMEAAFARLVIDELASDVDLTDADCGKSGSPPS